MSFQIVNSRLILNITNTPWNERVSGVTVNKTLSAPTDLNEQLDNIIWNLFDEQLNDVEDLGPSADEHWVLELMVVVLRLGVLSESIVPSHFFRHRYDERRRPSGGDECEAVTGCATRVGTWTQWKAARHAGQIRGEKNTHTKKWLPTREKSSNRNSIRGKRIHAHKIDIISIRFCPKYHVSPIDNMVIIIIRLVSAFTIIRQDITLFILKKDDDKVDLKCRSKWKRFKLFFETFCVWVTLNVVG